MLTAAGALVAAAPGRCCCPVLLAGSRSRLLPAGADGAAAQAEGPAGRPPRPRPPLKETNAKPQGPLIIAVSIEQQKVRVYDANGLFAESPVSTGMKGHSTPMGVFSVIQKNKMHRSNIYSGAPMPYMQRITLVGRCAACRRVAGLSGVARLYPHADGVCREDVELDRDGRARHRHAGCRSRPPPSCASVAGGAEGRAAAPHRRRSVNRRARDQKRQGRGRRPCGPSLANCAGEPRSPVDRRPRGASARTRPTPRMPASAIAGDQRRT